MSFHLGPFRVSLHVWRSTFRGDPLNPNDLDHTYNHLEAAHAYATWAKSELERSIA
jgi:hypothetical protein